MNSLGGTEAGGALGREAEAAPWQQTGVFPLLVLLSLAATEGHNQVTTHSFVSSAIHPASVAAFCKDIDLRIRKHMWTQSVLCHDPTGSWKVPQLWTRGASCHSPSLCATSLQKCEGKRKFKIF